MGRKSESRELKTTVDVMRELGGIGPVSALTGSSTKNTENWSRAETFPAHYFLVMTFALHGKGLSAPPELWRQVTPAERQQALRALISVQKRKVAA